MLPFGVSIHGAFYRWEALTFRFYRCIGPRPPLDLHQTGLDSVKHEGAWHFDLRRAALLGEK